MRHVLLLLGTAAVVLTACDSGSTEPGPNNDRLEIRLAAVWRSYPITDTVRATVFVIADDGSATPVGGAVWHSLTPTIASVSSTGLIRGLARGEATIEAEINGATARVQVPIRGILHTSIIDVSETWRVADTPHVVRGYLNVGGIVNLDATDTAVLTLEPGVIVRFRPRSGLYFADIEPGALRIPAGSPPVIMEGDSALRGSWVGISFEGPGRSELRNLTIRHCGANTPSGATIACLTASGAAVLFDDITISDAHDGVEIGHGVTIAPGSRNLSITNTIGHVATVSPQVVGSFPRGGQFTGNIENDIRITIGRVEQSAEWAPAGLPWRLTSEVIVTGPANPVITIPAGLVLRSDAGGKFTFESGGMVAGTSGGAPVVLESTGSGWGGIRTEHGGESAFRNVTLRDCGSASVACLHVEAFDETDPGILAENLTIRGARSTGVHFGIWGHFHPASSNITITGSGSYPLDVTPEGLSSIPPGAYTGNGIDAIRVRGGHIWRNETWRDLGVAYHVPDGIRIDWSLDPIPPTLTLEPGAEVYFGADQRLTVDIGRLVAVGTASSPVVLGSMTAGVPGSWWGIELERNGTMRLEHVEVADAGGWPSTFAGALRLSFDPGGLLRNSVIRRSSSCGVFLLEGEYTEDYSDPAFGNSFIDLARPAVCDAGDALGVTPTQP